MSLNNNAVNQLLKERERDFRCFREIYKRLDELIIAIYRPGLYTVREYDKIAAEYRILEPKADRLEELIRLRYPSKEIDKLIAWMKSNPRDDTYGEYDQEEEEPDWNEPNWDEPNWNEPRTLTQAG